jgi:uncharacterized protein YbjT (DUF2867 family)
MKRTALIFGSSGLVGSSLLKLVLEDQYYDKIKIFVRKKILVSSPKLEQIEVDFHHLDNVKDEISGDHLYLCLGTTMAKAGSKDAFYLVDHDFTLHAAHLAFANGVAKVCLISSMGADTSSNVYYSRVKGEIEKEVALIKFKAVHIVRPSLLLGDRKEKRLGERIGIMISKIFGFIFKGPMRKYAPIEDKTVAQAMMCLMQKAETGVHIHESIELQQLGLTSDIKK